MEMCIKDMEQVFQKKAFGILNVSIMLVRGNLSRIGKLMSHF